jgi:hypothetical protein
MALAFEDTLSVMGNQLLSRFPIQFKELKDISITQIFQYLKHEKHLFKIHSPFMPFFSIHTEGSNTR